MPKPDLVFYSEGRPVVVVEAKSRPITSPFEGPVLRQMRQYATIANTPWAILVDPESVRIFKGENLDRPFAVLSTGEILESVLGPNRPVVGERTLLVAVDRWLRHPDAILARHPDLEDLVANVGETFTSTEEWPPTPPPRSKK